MIKKVCWVTGDYFLQVDLPIIKQISDFVELHWVVVFGSYQKYYSITHIKNFCCTNNISCEIIHNSSASSPKLFFQQIKMLINLRRNKSDLYYFNYYGLPYFYFILKLFIDKSKSLVAVHNVKVPNGNRGEKLEKFYQNFGLNLLSNILTFSESQFSLAKKKFPKKNVFSIPLPLSDYGEPKRNNLNSKIQFLFFGNITKYKRLDILIKAVERLSCEQKSKIGVTIAGKDFVWSEYKKLIKSKLVFNLKIKTIPDEEVADLFATHHYLVLPYQDIAQSGPLKIAYRYNVPVVASNLDAFLEDIVHKENGFVFEKNNTDSLTEILKFIISNHNSFYSQMQVNLKNYVKNNLSNKSIINQYLKIFKNEF